MPPRRGTPTAAAVTRQLAPGRRRTVATTRHNLMHRGPTGAADGRQGSGAGGRKLGNTLCTNVLHDYIQHASFRWTTTTKRLHT